MAENDFVSAHLRNVLFYLLFARHLLHKRRAPKWCLNRRPSPFYTTRESLVYRLPIVGHFGGLCWAISIRLFPRDVDNHKAFDRWRFPMCFAYILLNKMKKYHNKSSFSFIIRWILGVFDYLCTQISVSWKETNGYCSTKTTKMPWNGRTINKGLSCGVKRAWSPVETSLGSPSFI